MDTSVECICCHEVEKIVDKMNENDTEIDCIINHAGFDPVCLNVWVLQTAYFQYRHHYGRNAPTPIHE